MKNWIRKILGIDNLEKSILNINKQLETIKNYIEIIYNRSNSENNLNISIEKIKDKIDSIPKEITIKNILSI